MPPIAIAVLLVLFVAGCTSIPTDDRLVGRHRCESFLIYDLCIADRDEDGEADYMYFEDTWEIFMFEVSLMHLVSQDLPLHKCAVPMNASTRAYGSQLLYSDKLGLSARLRLKGKLIRNYRAAQPAVDACYRGTGDSAELDQADDPFVLEDDWDEEAL